MNVLAFNTTALYFHNMFVYYCVYVWHAANISEHDMVLLKQISMVFLFAIYS